MRLQTKPDESTRVTKIPVGPQTTEQPSATRAESRSENVAPTARREKVASARPLGNRVVVVFANCAALFSTAALWQAPAATRFTPSGFVEGATRATEMVWYENVRIALAEKNLEAGRIDTAASLILASSPTQLHNEMDLTAIRKKILLSAIRKSDWNSAIDLALAKSILQSSKYETSEYLNLFWAEVARTGTYRRVREVVSKLPSSEKSQLMTALTKNLTTNGQSPGVSLSKEDLQEWIRAYPDNGHLRLKELVLDRGKVPALEILTKVWRLEKKFPLRANETDVDANGFKDLLIQDLVKAGQIDTALSNYRDMVPGNSTTQKISFVQHFAESFDIETLNALLKDGVKLLENEIDTMPGENVRFLRFDTVLMNIGTLSRAISDSKKQDEIPIQNVSSRLLVLEKQRISFLNLRRKDLK